MITYCVPSPGLGARDTRTSKTDTTSLLEPKVYGGDRHDQISHCIHNYNLEYLFQGESIRHSESQQLEPDVFGVRETPQVGALALVPEV